MSSITWSPADRHRSSNAADKSQHSRSQNGAGRSRKLPTLSLPIFELAVAAVISQRKLVDAIDGTISDQFVAVPQPTPATCVRYFK